jgi:hypothetical protein
MPEGTYGTEMPGGRFLARLIEPLAKRSIKSYRKTGGKNRMVAQYGKYPSETDREIPIVRLTRISG